VVFDLDQEEMKISTLILILIGIQENYQEVKNFYRESYSIAVRSKFDQ